MSERVQVIDRDGVPEWAVVPYEDYQRLVTLAEEAGDVRAYDEALGRAQAGEERVPARLAHRLVEGENPIRAWREHRGLTQAQLAEQAGVGQSYVAMLEAGERKGSVTRLRALARALGVELDDLAQ